MHRTDPDLVGFVTEKLDRTGGPLVSHPLPILLVAPPLSSSWREWGDTYWWMTVSAG